MGVENDSFWSERGSAGNTPPRLSGIIPPGKTVRFLYIIPLQPAVECKPSYKRHEMDCIAVYCFVPKKSSIKLHYLGIFITCVRGRLFHLFSKI